MPQYIIHKDGAFNVFCTVVDACYFEPALTLAELQEWYREEFGKHGMEGLPARIERAISHGTSAFTDDLDSHIRCGTRVSKVGRPEFIRRFLTLRPTDESPAPPEQSP